MPAPAALVAGRFEDISKKRPHLPGDAAFFFGRTDLPNVDHRAAARLGERDRDVASALAAVDDH